MSYDGTKLVYFDGKPQWLMPDGSFVPVKHQIDGSYAPGSLYLKERARETQCLIVD
ncbi:MAG: hypothetical protein LBQ42_06705 [Synergistaceae bacterium]|jgi:hypothetical protein|nr:hypothetical protein [Synergistaceae bacterium]